MPREYANVESSFIIVMINELVTLSSLSFCNTSTNANLSVVFDRRFICIDFDCHSQIIIKVLMLVMSISVAACSKVG